MKRSRIWLIAAAALLLIWCGVALVMQQTDHLVSWPEKVTTLMEASPWLKGDAKGSRESRQPHLNLVITHLNRLDAQHKRRLREDDQAVVDKFFASLTEDEQKEYVNRTVDPYLDRLERGLKAIPEEERKRLVTRMRGDMKNLRSGTQEGDRLSEQDREFMDSMIQEDPIFFLRNASTKAKMELAPVLEDMQSRLQGLRR